MNINASKMMEIANEAGEMLKTLSNPHRLVMLCQMIGGEKSVGELAEFLGIRDSTASQNLSLLRKAGVVSARRDGQTMWYSVQDKKVRLLLETLYHLYCAPHNLCESPVKPKNKRK